MMMDIFSSFDPSSFLSINTSSNLIFMTSILLITSMQLTFWLIPTRISMMMFMFLSIMYNQLARTYAFNLKGVSTSISIVFSSLIMLNLLGLNPYSFSLTSHLIITLSMGLPLWMSFILSSFLKNLKASIAHLLPDGAPDWLNPFLILIESTSILVRPLTLSFRLAANMSAGHIVLGLISIYAAAACLSSFYMFMLLLMTTLGYVLFEIAICLIQAYIFCLLLSLYANDHAH